MSLGAYLQACRDHLRTDLSLSEGECDVQPDGQPPPAFGPRYLAIHGAEWSPGDTTELVTGLDEIIGIDVTYTVRAPKNPQDRVMGGRSTGNLYLDSRIGMEKMCQRVMLSIHLNNDLMLMANTFIDGPDKYVEPLRWTGTDPNPITKGPEWVWSDAENLQNMRAAYVMTVRFRRARRLQGSTRYETMI